MSIDLERQVRAYAEFLDSTLPTLEAGSAAVGDPVRPLPAESLDHTERWRVQRGVWVAAAAAVAILLLVGGAALLTLRAGGGDVGDDPPAISHPEVPGMYRAVADFVLTTEIDEGEERSPDEGFVLLTDRPVVYVLDHPDDVSMFDCEGESSPGGAFECVPLPELEDTSGGEIRRDASLTGAGRFSDPVVRQIEAGLNGVNVAFVSDRDTVLGDYVFGGRPVANDGAFLRFGQIYTSAGKRLVTAQCLGCGGLSQDRLLLLELVDGAWTVQVDAARHFD